MFSKKKLLSTQEYGFDVSLFLGFLKGVLFIFLKIILWKLLFFKNLIFGLRIILTCITLYTHITHGCGYQLHSFLFRTNYYLNGIRTTVRQFMPSTLLNESWRPNELSHHGWFRVDTYDVLRIIFAEFSPISVS